MEYEGELVYEVELKDRDGFPTKKTCNFPAILTEKSIKRAESYEALRSGITLTAVFETIQPAHPFTFSSRYAAFFVRVTSEFESIVFPSQIITAFVI